MMSRQIRRAGAVFVLTLATLVLPLSDLSAAPRSESRWTSPERTVRVLRQGGLSFWNVLRSLWQGAGMRIDDNG